ncbi:MAG: NfeD family protein [Bacteroidota bacterium]|nr:NfeD family protein [Bacteroidota bacterium]
MKAIKLWGLLLIFLFGMSVLVTANISDSIVSADSICDDSLNEAIPDVSVKTTLDSSKFLIYKLEIFENITMSAWQNTQKALDEAIELNVDLFLIHMNTYGGLVIAADSIRTAFLNAPMPVWVFIDNNAASAGALISIASDKIFMRPGGNIGAATVVSQEGKAMPDKYQSYMRATMRSTAEAQGKDTIIQGNDTIVQWKRNPQIAEAMVDPDLYVPGIIDSTKVLTFTASEAVENGYCDGLYESIPELLAAEGVSDYETKTYVPTSMDKVMGFLTNPAFKSFLIMFIIGGLYFELQSPGIGFPFLIAVMAALLYFAPSYVEGLASNWEILIFVVGVILIGVEIFVIPGFGIAGVAGIALMITGLALSMIGQYEIQPIEGGEINLKPLVNALFYVIIAAIISFFFSLWMSSRLFSENRMFGNLSLSATQQKDEGYFSFDNKTFEMVGRKAIVVQELRPSGRVEIDDKRYDAKAINGYIERDTEVIVKQFESGQLYVDIINN